MSRYHNEGNGSVFYDIEFTDDSHENRSNHGLKTDPGNRDESKSGRMNPKAGEYVRELLAEKLNLNQQKNPHISRLIDEEIGKVQQIGKVRTDQTYVDVYREKLIKVTVKVLVPVKEHPKFNFVGKLLGPKGNSLKRLQEETMCKMAVLGKGSMKDRKREEELRKSLEPKYGHLSDELHVEVSALAPPAEAHARIAFALAELRKYLLPDYGDNVVRYNEQYREVEVLPSEMRPPPPPPPPPPMITEEYAVPRRRPTATGRSILPQRPVAPPPPPPPSMRTASRPHHSAAAGAPPPPPKTKVLSILDRARVAMEDSYRYERQTPGVYEDEQPPPLEEYYESYGVATHSRSYENSAAATSSYYDKYDHAALIQHYTDEDDNADYYGKATGSVGGGAAVAYESSHHRWKTSKSVRDSSGSRHHDSYRSKPYARNNKY